MAADVSLTMELQAKQLYDDLQKLQTHVAAFAAHAEAEGHKGGTGFVNSLKNAFSKVGDVFASLKNAVTSTAGLLGIGVGVGAGIAEIKSVVEFGAHVEDLSRKTGVNAEVLSRWGFAAQKTGTDIDTLSKFIGFLEINREKAARGDEKMEKNFTRQGVSAKDLLNPLVGINEIMKQFDPTKLNALDFKAVGGKGALQMVQLITEVNSGAISIDKHLSALDTKKLKELSDAFIDLKNAITVGLAPAIVQVFRSLEDHSDIFLTHIREAVIQLTALHDAAKTKTPGALFEILKKGQEATAQEEQGLFNRQTQREKARIEEATEAKKPPTGGPLSRLSDAADDIAGGKAAKKEAKTEAKAEKESEAYEKKNLDDFYAGKKATAKEALDRETADLDAYYAQNPGALTPKEQAVQEEQGAKEAEKNEKAEAKAKEKADAKSRKLDDAFTKNPAGLSLEEMAKHGALGTGAPGSVAKQIQADEARAKSLQLAGDLKGAGEAQSHAEKLKKSIGLASKEDAKDSTLAALNEAKVLKNIEKNTAKSGANK